MRPQRALSAALFLGLVLPASAPISALAQHFNGDRAFDITKQFVAIGPRWAGSPGHAKAESFLRNEFKHDHLEEDTFTANTPIGPVPMHNFIVKFPGKKDGVIVLCTHYETNYPLKDTSFLGANDGGATTGLLIEIANELRPQMTGGKLDGYSVWLLFDDGEEAIANPPYSANQWSDSTAMWGTRHLAAKWSQDGTLQRIKAFLLADMIGDKDLDVLKESQSTPWLTALVAEAARNTGHAKYFFASEGAEEDDHLPFLKRGVPSIDIIDVNYGPHNAQTPDGWHHTPQDTMDKISAKSLTISGDVFLESIKLIDRR
ncbi:M28 family peptidase [Acidicapsa dinghuensis]|uniref:M28 family peptidase n=1 Tax=Acidicapsa dinghuensis TaxID=2218256 RepID=A0ABW1EN48_9BACT|nr:M28 family peptidase [Acidicapsa dinghuensis]